jgi:hypothetical protein
MRNTAALWRQELDAILATDLRPRLPSAIAKTDKALEKLLKAEAKKPSSEFRSFGDIRLAYGAIADGMRRNSALVASLRAEGRHLLDARAAVLVAVERLAVVYPDREAEEAFESALAAALSWCLDLEARAKAGDTGDTPKKNGVANSKNPENAAFLAFLARKKNRPAELEPVAREWYLTLQRKSGLKVEENGKLKKHIRNKIKALARAARRAYEKGTLK